MPHTKVQAQLQTNLQTAYRQALDADKKLDELKKSGHVKFTAIFGKEENFTTQSNRFKPYVQELATEITALPTEDETFAQALSQLLPKLALLLQTLEAFKKSAK
ncbi:prephenate dehydrogenase [Shewanella surugensis]|uniref:Prephenate dehydrogenase n=1 Tax=Shewanella surugensis TaxID=212020 RepID=A0ABT0LAU0_9GAMM|nr:prephenate dehydrogenase [Shewanella surugensis]MCL1124818.1 prephenate dehydrogenase [Shewanella surugensis]